MKKNPTAQLLGLTNKMLIDIRDFPVYYINLDSQPDRRNTTENTLYDLGFNNINRVSAIQHTNPTVGCALSHLKVMMDKSIPTPFILFEDDIEYTGNEKLLYEVPDDADALFLGTSIWGRFLNFNGQFVTYKKVSDDVVRVYNMLSAHAVLHLSAGYREHLSRVAHHSAYEIQDHMDVGYAETQKYYNIYSVNKPIFNQNTHQSSATSTPITEMGMDLEESKKFFESKKWNLDLAGIETLSGWVSNYDPKHLS